MPLEGRPVKRLFCDIEVTPNLVWSWRIGYNINLSHDNIVVERKVICIGYKWEGEKKRTVLRWDKNQCDRKMLSDFMAVARQADELVAHYGDGFDFPWLRTRCLILGVEPLPTSTKTVDTKAWASKYFYFNSNKLDYLSSVLGHGHKLHTEFDLWLKVIAGDQAALDYMCKYCGIDCDRLEKVWNDLRRWVKPKTHAGVLSGGEKWMCAHCGSTNVCVTKRRVSASGVVTYQMKCKDCGGYYTISESAHRNYLEYKKKQYGKAK